MAIPLVLVAAEGRRRELAIGTTLEMDAIDRLNTSGDLVIGSNLGATEEITLATTTSVVHVLGDSELDGDVAFGGVATFGEPTSQTTSGATLTIDFSVGQKHRIILDSNITTVNITDPPGAGNFTVEFVQNTPGGFTVTGWPTNVRWLDGVEPTFGGATASLRLVSFYYNGPTEDDYFGEFNSGAYS